MRFSAKDTREVASPEGSPLSALGLAISLLTFKTTQNYANSHIRELRPARSMRAFSCPTEITMKKAKPAATDKKAKPAEGAGGAKKPGKSKSGY